MRDNSINSKKKNCKENLIFEIWGFPHIAENVEKLIHKEQNSKCKVQSVKPSVKFKVFRFLDLSLTLIFDF